MTAMSGAAEKITLFFFANPRAQFHVVSFIWRSYPNLAQLQATESPLMRTGRCTFPDPVVLETCIDGFSTT